MKLFCKSALILISTFCFSSNALAWVDLQVFGGGTLFQSKRDGEYRHVFSLDHKVALHWDKFPRRSYLEAGIYWLRQNVQTDADSNLFSYDSFKGDQFGLEVGAKLPTTFLKTHPYTRLGLSFLGSYKGEFKTSYTDPKTLKVVENDCEIKYKQYSVNLHLGTRYKLGKYFAVLIDGAFMYSHLTPDEVTQNGESVSTSTYSKRDLYNLAISLGLEARI